MAPRAVPLSDLAIINPKHEKGTASNTPVSFVRMSDVDSESASVTHEELRTFEETAKGFTQFKKGDILLAKITPCFENGKIAQANISESLGSGSTEFHVIRAREGSADPRFLLHMLRHPKIIFDGERKMTGSSGHRRVPELYVASITIPNYPLETQRKIGEELDVLESIREKRRNSIELLGELTQSVFLDMFGDPRANEKGWPVKEFGDITESLRYGTSNKSSSSGYPALRIPNVVSGDLNLTEIKNVPASAAELERLRLRDGDLLFVRSNGNPDYVGRCAIFDQESVAHTGHDPESFIYASYLIRARLNLESVEPVYVREFMLSPHGRAELKKKSKTSAGQYNLNGKGLNSIRVPIPPIELQKEFANRVARIALTRETYQTHLSYLDELFASVQQRAFDGTLWDDPDVAA